jgi:endonuclease/exonuclease/phosphatase family metal-dependent hydrolase
MSETETFDRPSSPATTIRVLTHNIFGRRAGWEERRRVLRDGLRILAPDVILLQETIATDGYDQVADLVGDAYHIIHSRARETDGQGIAIASRWPIGATREPDLKVTPRTSDFACTTLLAAIEMPAPIGPLLIVNHFPDYQPDHEHERELQTVLAAREIEAMAPDRSTHVVLAGDLDAEIDAASLRFLAGKQSLDGMSVCYRNAWDSARPSEPGHTFTSQNPLAPPDWPFQRIDHVFVRCGEQGGPTLRIAACEVVFDQPVAGVWASDHFAVLADLALPPPGDQASS